jgi:hypothetical protein
MIKLVGGGVRRSERASYAAVALGRAKFDFTNEQYIMNRA